MAEETLAPTPAETPAAPTTPAADTVSSPEAKPDAAPDAPKVLTREEVKARRAELREGKKPESESKPDTAAKPEVEEGKLEAEPKDEEGNDRVFLHKRGKDGKFLPAGEFVPKGEFNKAFEKGKEADTYRAENATLRARMEQQDKSIEALLAMAKPKPDAPASDAFDPLDPDADKKYSSALEKQDNEIKEIKNTIALGNYVQAALQQRTSFEQANPDYQDAMNHLFAVKRAEALYEMGGEVGKSELERKQADIAAGKKALERMAQMQAGAYQRGMNTAQAAYEMAKTLGYSKKAARAEGQNLEAIDANKRKSASISNIRGESLDLGSELPTTTGKSFNEKYVKRDANGRVLGTDRVKLKEAMAAARRQNMSASA